MESRADEEADVKDTIEGCSIDAVCPVADGDGAELVGKVVSDGSSTYLVTVETTKLVEVSTASCWGDATSCCILCCPRSVEPGLAWTVATTTDVRKSVTVRVVVDEGRCEGASTDLLLIPAISLFAVCRLIEYGKEAGEEDVFTLHGR